MMRKRQILRRRRLTTSVSKRATSYYTESEHRCPLPFRIMQRRMRLRIRVGRVRRLHEYVRQRAARMPSAPKCRARPQLSIWRGFSYITVKWFALFVVGQFEYPQVAQRGALWETVGMADIEKFVPKNGQVVTAQGHEGTFKVLNVSEDGQSADIQPFSLSRQMLLGAE